VVPEKAREIPERWHDFLGSYGPDFIPLILSARNGHLYAMTENMFDYRLTPLNSLVFKMPPGLYTDEQLVFQTDSGGRVRGLVLASMPLGRPGLVEGAGAGTSNGPGETKENVQ
jgi:hypothetical protein